MFGRKEEPEPRPALDPAPIGARRENGRSGASSEVHIGTVNVHSNASDPRQVAEEVADEIERRQHDERLRIESAVTADDTTEAYY